MWLSCGTELVLGAKWDSHGQQVVAWDWNTANAHDQVFLPLVEAVCGRSIVLGDVGFSDASGITANLKRRPKGTWNECMFVETMLSMIAMVCRVKKMFHRLRDCVEMHFAYLAALFNTLLELNRIFDPNAKAQGTLLYIAQYALEQHQRLVVSLGTNHDMNTDALAKGFYLISC